MKFRKRPVIVEATQWVKNGDHPQDDCFRTYEDTGVIPTEPREGKIVRYFRHPGIPGGHECEHCGVTMHNHGWIDTLGGGHIVCPFDWIITGVENEKYPCKPGIFHKTYELVEEQ